MAAFLTVSTLYAAPTQKLDANKITSTLTQRYGERAGLRAKAWFKVVAEAQNLPEKQQLDKVNQFFNLFRFVDDIVLWGDSNYWATPMEFIGMPDLFGESGDPMELLDKYGMTHPHIRLAVEKVIGRKNR